MSPRPQLLLVFFTSSRSGPARRMESVLAHIARKERSHVDVIRVEVGQQPELADRFGVEAIPTLVLVRDKLVVDRLTGRASAPQIERMLERHLAPERHGDLALLDPADHS
ncbi:MAG: thioredoxin family protein [Actinomycetota bacterium]|nr:thioredoxin family protein [Actinomycetota bacterium]MDQ2983017.1 thioredoxin family protein [Actinomycetota bacterium]